MPDEITARQLKFLEKSTALFGEQVAAAYRVAEAHLGIAPGSLTEDMVLRIVQILAINQQSMYTDFAALRASSN